MKIELRSAIRARVLFAALLAVAASANASVQMTQFSVDPTPPPPPTPAPRAAPSPPAAQPAGAPAVSPPAVDASVDYPSLIRNQSTLESLGPSLFGESVDYYTGSTDLITTDVSVPLNSGLPMAVSRRYHVGNRYGGALAGSFGDWDLDLPHIEVVLATSVGWTVPNQSGSNPCAKFSAPSDAQVIVNGVTTDIPAAEYTQGYQLVIPGQGRRELLVRDPNNTYTPGNDYGKYPIVTHDWWAVGCSTDVGQGVAGQPAAPGQDFITVSPDGVQYTFSTYFTRTYPAYQRLADDQTSLSGTVVTLPRVQAIMLPSLIEDRYGNWVAYTYGVTDSNGYPRLTKITASDSTTPTITISLNTDFTIKSVENNVAGNGRVWKYSYTSGVLTGVTLPDSSSWTIDLSKLNAATWTYTNPTCTNLPSPTYPSGSSLSGSSPSVTGTLTAPSGAAATLTFSMTRRGRSGTPTSNNCLTNAKNVAFAAKQAPLYDTLALTKKAITGPGISGTYTWSVAYDVCSGTSCPSALTTTLTDARGYDTTYKFSTAWSATATSDTEGQLTEIDAGGQSKSGYLRTDSYTYYTNCGSACPTTLGAATQVRGDSVPLSTLKPLNVHSISQDGASYTHTESNPDAYGFPQTITRKGNATKTDTLTYQHDPGLWVIGTPTQLVSDSATEWKVVLDSFDTPQELDRFGLKIRTYTHQTDGTLWTVTDGKGQSTTYTNYKGGLPQSISYANGDSESAVVRYDGKITSWTDADNHQTQYGYDTGARVNDVTYPTDPAANYSDLLSTWSTSSSGWSRSQTAGTYSRITTYDAFLQPITDNEGSKRYTATTYDPDGRVTFASSVEGSANPADGTHYVYDGIGRLSSATDAAGNSIQYTPQKYGMQVTDRDGNTTTNTYQQYDTPSLSWPTTISTATASTSLTRDTWGKVTAFTRGNVTRKRDFDTNQRLSQIEDPERTDTLTFGYDLANNVNSINRNGTAVQTLGYDKRNRLTSITDDTKTKYPTVTFGWSGAGDLLLQSRGSNSHSYTYTARHAVYTETITTDNGSYGLSYGYDNLAHRTSFTYPDNTSVSYAPDSLGNPQEVGSFATSLQFYPHGAVKSFVYGNGIGHTMTLTTDGRLLPYEVTDSGSVMNLTYTYDGNAFPTQIVDGESGNALTRTLHYTTNRIDSAVGPKLWGTTTFNYDSTTPGQDNLYEDVTTPSGGSAVTTVYDFNDSTNRPTSITVNNGTPLLLSWDGQGNLIQKGSGATAAVLTWDTSNELLSFAQNGTTTTYSYDGKGNRSTTAASSGIGNPSQQTDSVYDAAGRLVYESTNTAPPSDRIFLGNFEVAVPALQTTRYVYLGMHALAKSVTAGKTTTTTYLHTDALGSPVAQTDSSKNIIGTSGYLPFGGLAASTGTGSVPGIGFAGSSNDLTGLVYMHSRYLDPQLHRFISMDPVDVHTDTVVNFNRQSYALNSPYFYYDPSGREDPCSRSPLKCQQGKNGMTVGQSAAIALGTVALGGLGTALGPTLYALGSDIASYGLINGLALNPAATTTVGVIAVDTGATLASGQVATTTSLSQPVIDSFAGGKFELQTLASDTTAYRAERSSFDGTTFGQFYGLQQPQSAADAERLFNVVDYGNDVSQLATYNIPSGTNVYLGPVSGGDGTQMYIPNPSDSGVQLMDVQPLVQDTF